MNPLDFTLTELQVFILMFFRIAGIIMFTPLFGSPNIPPQVKIMLSLVLALVFYPKMRESGQIPENLGAYFMAVGCEFILGLLIGLAFSMIFMVAQLAGQVIDYEMGLGLANVIDPISNRMVSVLGQLKLTLGMFVFLALDGHHWVIQAITQSMRSIPLMGLNLSRDVALKLSQEMFSRVLVLGMRVAAPALLTMLLVSISIAFLARLMPQLNLFAIGFGLKIMVTFIILIMALPLFINLFEGALLRWMISIREFIPMLG
jgi:flagellar biosynthetic protein FliR